MVLPVFLFDEQERLPEASQRPTLAPKSCQVFKGRGSRESQFGLRESNSHSRLQRPLSYL
jgi:hypothetical protein